MPKTTTQATTRFVVMFRVADCGVTSPILSGPSRMGSIGWAVSTPGGVRVVSGAASNVVAGATAAKAVRALSALWDVAQAKKAGARRTVTRNGPNRVQFMSVTTGYRAGRLCPDHNALLEFFVSSEWPARYHRHELFVGRVNVARVFQALLERLPHLILEDVLGYGVVVWFPLAI